MSQRHAIKKSPTGLDMVFMGFLGFGIFMAGCTSVNTLLLTSQTFPAKSSWQSVRILDREPFCSHISIAQLSMEGSESDSYATWQIDILKKAASLGSDAVVFTKPEKHVEHSIRYQSPMVMGGPWGMGAYGYPGWGYGGPYGPWGMGYVGGVALPYDYTVTSLTGIAIRYTNKGHPQC
ncbi:hypothetical protein ACTRXD_22195 [Nitrospira sp. T9]|uniref:hypothetical protein n=1 Tax=unclassified Nitrospira TaxID=2652172 RepID=UPI003F94B55F